MSFEYPIELPLQVNVKLTENGIERPFPVQTHSALPIVELKNLKILAPTGSGKTLAYLLPLGKLLTEKRDRNLIVLGSSPELVAQISNVFREYFPDLDTALIVGGANLRRQKDKMKTRPKAVFATPGRLFDGHFINLYSVDFIPSRNWRGKTLYYKKQMTINWFPMVFGKKAWKKHLKDYFKLQKISKHIAEDDKLLEEVYWVLRGRWENMKHEMGLVRYYTHFIRSFFSISRLTMKRLIKKDIPEKAKR